MASVFTKIMKGELPGFKIFEDELIFVFLNIRPVQLGHTLVIPKREVDHVLDVDRKEYLRVFEAAQSVGKAIHQATECKRVVYAVAGFEVHHFHLHLIPAWDLTDCNFSKAREVSPDQLKAVQEKILRCLPKNI